MGPRSLCAGVASVLQGGWGRCREPSLTVLPHADEKAETGESPARPHSNLQHAPVLEDGAGARERGPGPRP